MTEHRLGKPRALTGIECAVVGHCGPGNECPDADVYLGLRIHNRHLR
jgi:hypothetical protein